MSGKNKSEKTPPIKVEDQTAINEASEPVNTAPEENYNEIDEPKHEKTEEASLMLSTSEEASPKKNSSKKTTSKKGSYKKSSADKSSTKEKSLEEDSHMSIISQESSPETRTPKDYSSVDGSTKDDPLESSSKGDSPKKISSKKRSFKNTAPKEGSHEDSSTVEGLPKEESPKASSPEQDSPEDNTEGAGGNKLFSFKFTRNNVLQILRYICIVGFVIFSGLFINETVIQPYRTKKVIDYTRDLYHRPEEETKEEATPIPTESPVQKETEASPSPAPTVTEAPSPTPTPDPNRDEQGRLLQFQELLEKNEDTKGWITIPGTNIDYVVVQSGKEDPEFYLFKGFDKEYNKAGTLFLDHQSSVENKTRNLVIHGHNMVSTKEKMFRKILSYKNDIDFYREHPIIYFDTIYETGTWKIFAVFITPPDPTAEDFFEFRKSTFKDSSEFLNFVYQIRIRSLINVDSVDINENDELLTLSTCSYEVNDDYRTVLVARKVREGEDITVDTKSAKMNKTPYFAKDYRKKYGKNIPDVAATFEEALEKGQIKWYNPPQEKQEE
jgi:sortase B